MRLLDDDLIEDLAEHAHNSWLVWLFSNMDSPVFEAAKSQEELWHPYSMLPEHVKESYRDRAAVLADSLVNREILYYTRPVPAEGHIRE